MVRVFVGNITRTTNNYTAVNQKGVDLVLGMICNRLALQGYNILRSYASTIQVGEFYVYT